MSHSRPEPSATRVAGELPTAGFSALLAQTADQKIVVESNPEPERREVRDQGTVLERPATPSMPPQISTFESAKTTGLLRFDTILPQYHFDLGKTSVGSSQKQASNLSGHSDQLADRTLFRLHNTKTPSFDEQTLKSARQAEAIIDLPTMDTRKAQVLKIAPLKQELEPDKVRIQPLLVRPSREIADPVQAVNFEDQPHDRNGYVKNQPTSSNPSEALGPQILSNEKPISAPLTEKTAPTSPARSTIPPGKEGELGTPRISPPTAEASGRVQQAKHVPVQPIPQAHSSLQIVNGVKAENHQKLIKTYDTPANQEIVSPKTSDQTGFRISVNNNPPNVPTTEKMAQETFGESMSPSRDNETSGASNNPHSRAVQAGQTAKSNHVPNDPGPSSLFRPITDSVRLEWAGRLAGEGAASSRNQPEVKPTSTDFTTQSPQNISAKSEKSVAEAPAETSSAKAGLPKGEAVRTAPVLTVGESPGKNSRVVNQGENHPNSPFRQSPVTFSLHKPSLRPTSPVGRGQPKTKSADSVKGASQPLRGSRESSENGQLTAAASKSNQAAIVKSFALPFLKPGQAALGQAKVKNIQNLQALVQKIQAQARLLSRGEVATLQVRLIPPHLGALRVQIEVEGREMHLHFFAERGEAVACLQESRADLSQLMTAQGYSLTQCDVENRSLHQGRWEEMHSQSNVGSENADGGDESGENASQQEGSTNPHRSLYLGYNTLDLVA